MRARTREVFEKLCEAYKERGVPPTTRQLTERLGLSVNRHLSSVYYTLLDLQELGLIEKQVPGSVGMYVPVLSPDEVNWETLEGDGDGRETLEESGEGDSGVLRNAPDSQEGG